MSKKTPPYVQGIVDTLNEIIKSHLQSSIDLNASLLSCQALIDDNNYIEFYLDIDDDGNVIVIERDLTDL